MGKANFSDDSKRDAVAQITERGLSGCGGVTASRRQSVFALRVEEEVFTVARRGRQGRRDQVPEA